MQKYNSYHENYAHASHKWEDILDLTKHIAEVIDAMWQSIKNGSMQEDGFHPAIDTLAGFIDEQVVKYSELSEIMRSFNAFDVQDTTTDTNPVSDSSTDTATKSH